MIHRHRKLACLLGLIAVGMLLLSACGSSGSSASGANGAQATQAGASTGNAYNLAAAIAATQKAEQRPTTIGVTGKIDSPIPTGKTIDRVTCGGTECQQTCQLQQQAAAALHWSVKCINGGVTPESIQAAYDVAIRDHPSAVISDSFVSSLYKPQLAELYKLGIPVVTDATTDEPGPGSPIKANVYGQSDWVHQGEQLADYMMASNGGKAFNVVDVFPSVYSSLVGNAQGITQTLGAACPACKVY